jgi:hypothetical protein
MYFRDEERMERGLKGIDVEIIVSYTNKMVREGNKIHKFHTYTHRGCALKPPYLKLGGRGGDGRERKLGIR